jgi:catechol 2,3-dioxygenase-like lactoylglutathione lyase family enzyme
MALSFKTDHLAFVTGDTKRTVDFYTRVMGWPLVGAHTGLEPDGRRFCISAFEGDGWLLEFEEVEGREGPQPQAPGFPHLGLDVATADEYDRWKLHLGDCGVAFLETRPHNCFFSDPNGLSFQLIVKEPDTETTDAKAARARKMVEEWTS